VSNLRNSQLLQQMQAHPLKSSLAKALDIAENFAGDVEFLRLDNNLSNAGRQNARSTKLRAAVRDLRDARAPIGELQKKLEAKRAAVSMPKFDPADVVGFLRRQELRQTMRTMDPGPRTLLLQDPMFQDAMLEQHPALSGLQPQQIGADKSEGNQDFLLVEAAKKQRLETLFAAQIPEIDDLDKTIAEANMIADIALNDLALHSGMERPAFDEFRKPIETKVGAPWLKRSKDAAGKEIIVVIDVGSHTAPIATADQLRDGKYYRDHAEYLADRAAA
jgi:hypothetical protein